MPPDSIQILQLAILWLSAAAFALAFLLGWRYMRAAAFANTPTTELPASHERTRLGPAAHVGFLTGLLLALALAVWRLIAQDHATGRLIPLYNFFDAFLFLGLLLAALGLYFRLTRHLRSLAFFLLPIIAVVLFLGGLLSLRHAQPFDDRSALNLVHVASVMIGSVCFAAGCAGGIVYLLADRQLRRKGLAASSRWIRFPALSRMERFNQFAVYLGFPLLTIAMVTGALRAYQVIPTAGAVGSGGGDGGASGGGSGGGSAKIILAVAAWLVYAVLLHLPLAPLFRGRRAAWLSIVGFVLLLSVFFAVRWAAHAP